MTVVCDIEAQARQLRRDAVVAARRQLWVIADVRTGRPIGSGCYVSETQVIATMRLWVVRDDAGGRQDLHEVIPFMVPKRLR